MCCLLKESEGEGQEVGTVFLLPLEPCHTRIREPASPYKGGTSGEQDTGRGSR